MQMFLTHHQQLLCRGEEERRQSGAALPAVVKAVAVAVASETLTKLMTMKGQSLQKIDWYRLFKTL
jgi:hypothetical protein